MTSSLPESVQWFSALATPIIAALVATIAWRQYKTAHEKLLFDLFEKRWEIYEAANRAAGHVLTHADIKDDVVIRDVAVLRNRAQFVFGAEVVNELEMLQKRMAKVSYASQMMKSRDEKHQEYVKLKYDHILEISKFNDEFTAKCAPYMKLQAKL